MCISARPGLPKRNGAVARRDGFRPCLQSDEPRQSNIRIDANLRMAHQSASVTERDRRLMLRSFPEPHIAAVAALLPRGGQVGSLTGWWSSSWPGSPVAAAAIRKATASSLSPSIPRLRGRPSTGKARPPQIDTPENRAASFAYKAVVEMAGSTETDKVREAPGGTGRLNQISHRLEFI